MNHLLLVFLLFVVIMPVVVQLVDVYIHVVDVARVYETSVCVVLVSYSVFYLIDYILNMLWQDWVKNKASRPDHLTLAMKEQLAQESQDDILLTSAQRGWLNYHSNPGVDTIDWAAFDELFNETLPQSQLPLVVPEPLITGDDEHGYMWTYLLNDTDSKEVSVDRKSYTSIQEVQQVADSHVKQLHTQPMSSEWIRTGVEAWLLGKELKNADFLPICGVDLLRIADAKFIVVYRCKNKVSLQEYKKEINTYESIIEKQIPQLQSIWSARGYISNSHMNIRYAVFRVKESVQNIDSLKTNTNALLCS